MTSSDDDAIAPRVIVCDRDSAAAKILVEALARVEPAATCEVCQSIDELLSALDRTMISVVFIDPFSFGLDKAADVIFEIRRSHPWIAFVLYIDVAGAERQRSTFYRGRRSRFSHYYRLDKATPLLAFDREVASLLTATQQWAMKRLFGNAKSHRASELDNLTTKGLRSLAEKSSSYGGLSFRPNTVFLSHRFAETEFVDGLQQLLAQSGFDVVKGDSANTFVSQAVLQRIKECEFVLCLITKVHEKSDGTYLTSGWILEEKGAALAFGKPLVLMVEEGVIDIGGLQGDWQRIHFTPRGFLKAALQAVDQLRSYSGR